MPSAPKFFDLPFTKIMYSLKMYLFSFQYQSDVQLTVYFFQFAFINTFNQLFMFQFSFQFHSIKIFFKHNIGLSLDFKHNIDLSLT